MVESDLCKKVRYGIDWDPISMKGLFPRSDKIQNGYRINITLEKEEDIEEAKRILKENRVDSVEDKIASSFSKTIMPGDRTLRVIVQNQSVINLEKMWDKERANSPYGRAMKAARGGR